MVHHKHKKPPFTGKEDFRIPEKQAAQSMMPIAERCLVEVFSMSDTRTLKFFMVPQKVGTHFRDYQQIESGSTLGQQLIGRKVGDVIKVGENSFMIKRVERLQL